MLGGAVWIWRVRSRRWRKWLSRSRRPSQTERAVRMTVVSNWLFSSLCSQERSDGRRKGVARSQRQTYDYVVLILLSPTASQPCRSLALHFLQSTFSPTLESSRPLLRDLAESTRAARRSWGRLLKRGDVGCEQLVLPFLEEVRKPDRGRRGSVQFESSRNQGRVADEGGSENRQRRECG